MGLKCEDATAPIKCVFFAVAVGEVACIGALSLSVTFRKGKNGIVVGCGLWVVTVLPLRREGTGAGKGRCEKGVEK